MNILEAINSNRPFTRPKWPHFLTGKEVYTYAFDGDDVLAEDYYLEDKQITITANQFDLAWSRADNAVNTGEERILGLMKDRLKKELGL